MKKIVLLLAMLALSGSLAFAYAGEVNEGYEGISPAICWQLPDCQGPDWILTPPPPPCPTEVQPCPNPIFPTP